ncbi:sporulation related protein [Umboniibacter marinipuniceus]|uniref:Sporulation related protein n=2 Tax=Umboniibacter marinipuniceus TaxID=569599 RepID=A0A3M0A6L6_9GAMM|nr:sporulation related protein [Umboniibacter marinipuniceus]
MVATKNKRKPQRGAKRRAGKRNANSPMPKIVGGILGAGVLFAGIVWLSQLPKPSFNDEASSSQTSAEVSSSQADAIVEDAPVEIEYEFYDTLPNEEVIVDAQPGQRNAGPQDFYYNLQAASFRQSEDAERARVELLLAGLNASIRTVSDADGNPWHRIMVGPFEQYGPMDEARRQLIERGMTPLVFKRPKEDNQ